MGSLADGHDEAISRPETSDEPLAGQHGGFWFGDAPLMMLRSPTLFEPLSPVALLSPLDFGGGSVSFLKSRTSSSSLTDDDAWQHRPLTRSTGSFNTNTPHNTGVDADGGQDNIVTSTLFLPTGDTFFLSTPSRSSLASFTTTSSDGGTNSEAASFSESATSLSLNPLAGAMPSQTRAAADDAGGAVIAWGNSTFVSANGTANRRPKSSRSAKSARSSSPLFKGWTGRGKHNNKGEDGAEANGDSSPGFGWGLASEGKEQPPPPLTRAEFEALPIAIQRKVRVLTFGSLSVRRVLPQPRQREIGRHVPIHSRHGTPASISAPLSSRPIGRGREREKKKERPPVPDEEGPIGKSHEIELQRRLPPSFPHHFHSGTRFPETRGGRQ
jgi:hypothetical protein